MSRSISFSKLVFACSLAIIFIKLYASGLPSVEAKEKLPCGQGGAGPNDVFTTGKFPFIVAIKLKQQKGPFLCAATIVDNDKVVTAASCL